MKFEIDKIPTWTTDEELELLTDFACNSEYILESGCYMGASAKALLFGNQKSHLWTVDKFLVFGTEQITRAFLRNWIEIDRCELIVGDMDKAGELLTHMRGKIDLFWCDDGHAKEDVQRDIRNALPLLRSGGVMVGHDWDGDNDVAQGVLSMLPRNELTFPLPRIWKWIKP